MITLLTDFGAQDYFVGAMKGVILSANPSALVVDLTHDISPQDVHAAAFNLLACYKDFPSGTIHVAVVDPGVGSARRPLLIECAGQFFVGPDNGLFSWICEREKSFVARQLTAEKFFRQPTSRTFHGRDVFAPVAAALSNAVAPEEFGPVVDNLVLLESLSPKVRADGALEGALIHIDRFGNCISNFISDHLQSADGNPKLIVNGRAITSVRQIFSDSKDVDELFMIVGSAGFVEIAARNSSAAVILKAQRGQKALLFQGF